jgi:hypothetical protein
MLDLFIYGLSNDSASSLQQFFFFLLLPLGSMGLIYHFLDHSQTVGLLG